VTIDQPKESVIGIRWPHSKFQDPISDFILVLVLLLSTICGNE